MPRIRTIKPEFWADEKISLLDPLTRLVFLGLICMADDAGRLVDNVKLLDGQIFPSTDDSCRESLDTLARTERVLRYRSPSGQDLIQIANWSKHQRVDNPSKYTLPGPATAIAVQPSVPSEDANGARTDRAPEKPKSRETHARSSPSDLRPTTNDLGPSTNDPRPATTDQVRAAAIAMTVRANQGLAEHPRRPQPIPRIMGGGAKSFEAAETLLNAGVPLSFAEAAIYDLAKNHGAEGEVRSLTYFVPGVKRLWAEHGEATALASTGRIAGSTNGTRPLTEQEALARWAAEEKVNA